MVQRNNQSPSDQLQPHDDAAQSLAVKRAEVEFHNFASLGEPERAARVYAEENERRGGILDAHLDFVGPLTPFLEIGANAGHSSYMLANQFGAKGFALDISEDSLRYGMVLKDRWGLEHSPVLLSGDALHLPFADNSLRMVCAFQMLSQFMDIESVIVEVKRVLQPGGIFFFAEEPMRRLLTARLYRCPYYDTMKPWERKLYDWGLLGFLVKDVIGAHQEESFGIRQNHRMYLSDWHRLVTKHFADHRYQLFVPERGWAETVVKKTAVALDPHGSEWRAARLMGGTLAALCRKEGDAPSADFQLEHFENILQCPDCAARLSRDTEESLTCSQCGYSAPLREGVYNLLPSQDKRELYPGDRADIVDFSLPGHVAHLGHGWYDLEGIYGNKYRWMAARASLWLDNVKGGEQRLRLRGFAPEAIFRANPKPVVEIFVNGLPTKAWTLDRNGLFALETNLPAAERYNLEIRVSPVWHPQNDKRDLSVNFGMVRLIPIEN
ncbi:MAG: methyltransferase domain-containing protein [Bryobacter sp.]|nr:methyltransferase domain-containing protein [Bryobacter sp.]